VWKPGPVISAFSLVRKSLDWRRAIAAEMTDAQSEAETKVSADEFSHLQRNTRNAWDEMMLFARCVILCRPTTRRGLIHLVRYLVSQFNDLEGCQGSCNYFPDEIGERPWPMAFLLAAGLRKMAGELDPQKEGSRQ
jgi:hypothetical protein